MQWADDSGHRYSSFRSLTLATRALAALVTSEDADALRAWLPSPDDEVTDAIGGA